VNFLNRKGVIGFALLGVVIGLVVGYSISIILPYQPVTKQAISLSSNSIKAGTQYTATLSGFPANTNIYGWTVNQETPTCFNAGTTDANGKLVVSADAPATTGTFPLIACDESETIWAVTTIVVT
jgi:hypothetical protein